MTQPSATQSVQQMLLSEQQLLARRGALTETLSDIDSQLKSVRAAIQGVQLGQQLAAEAAATPASDDPLAFMPPEEAPEN